MPCTAAVHHHDAVHRGKAAHRLTLTVLDRDDWGTHVTLIGHVAEMVEDEELSDIDRLSRHYLGRPYPTRNRRRVSAWIEVDRWHGWGTFRDSGQSAPELDLHL